MNAESRNKEEVGEGSGSEGGKEMVSGRSGTSVQKQGALVFEPSQMLRVISRAQAISVSRGLEVLCRY